MDGATVVESKDWIDWWFQILGAVLATAIIVAMIVALVFLMRDWRRSKQHRWPCD